MGAHRLDAVVKVRERDEEKAELELAKASEAAATARLSLARAQEKLTQGEFSAGSAADWELRDVGKVHDRWQVKKAEQQVVAAEKVQAKARASHVVAHQRTEAVRRVADSRREQERVEANRREQRVTDEFVMLRRAAYSG